MKDKWTDLAAGRLGPSKPPNHAADEPGEDRPPGRPRRRPPAAGNYGIGRLGIVPSETMPASPPPVEEPAPENPSPREAVSRAKTAPVRPAARSDESLLLEPSWDEPRSPPARVGGDFHLVLDPPQSDWAPQAGTPDPAPIPIWRRAWQAVASRPAWAACACGAAVLCGVVGLMLLRSSGDGVPRSASAKSAQAPPATPAPAAPTPPERASPASPPKRVVAVPPSAGTGGEPLPGTGEPPMPPQTSPAPPFLSRTAQDFLAGVRAELDDWSRKAPSGGPRPVDPAVPARQVPVPGGAIPSGPDGTPASSESVGNVRLKPVEVAHPAPGPDTVARGEPATAPAVRNVGYSVSSGIVVSAILRGREGPVALINNEVCRPGGTVGGAKVISIGESSVELEQDGQRFQVSVSAAPAPPPAPSEPVEVDEPAPAPAEQPREPRRPAKKPQTVPVPAPR